MSTDCRPLAVFLMGPTASGKTALACRLADRFPVELISVDSALVYRGMDIGTAKPDAAVRARYPHALIDIREPGQPYSAADFRDDALANMRAVTQRGNIPLLVGGTGLYFRALQRGLAPLPAADAQLRERLVGEARTVGWPALHARLATLDPRAAARIRPSDAQRIQRALEVIELTGRSLSEQQHDWRSQRLGWRVLKLALVPGDRRVLHRRIEQRFEVMLTRGFLAEVGHLLGKNADPDLPAWRAVGYRQARDHLQGNVDQAGFRQRAVAATRQLAKRQITWLRRELDARWLDTLATDAQQCACSALERFVH